MALHENKQDMKTKGAKSRKLYGGRDSPLRKGATNLDFFKKLRELSAQSQP